MKTLYSTLLAALILCGTSTRAQFSLTLNPVQDAYFISMGGGQGGNAMLKFDISSLPAGANITSATLEVYVWDTLHGNGFSASILGNMHFMNMNGRQAWVESDSSYKFALNQNVFSDTITQLTGFGDTIGWTSSVNIGDIVSHDHALLNQFCTIVMKDPDDGTCCGAMGANFSQFLANSTDTMMNGNKMIGTDQIMFYPREKANYMPRLTVIYSCPVDVSIQTSGNTITANEANGTYRWLDCNNSMAVIPGETNQSFTVMASGNYAVEVTKGGCKDTSACQNITFMGVANHSLVAHTYPNPVKDMLKVEVQNGNYEVMLCDISGRVIYRSVANAKLGIDMKNENKGLYLLKITNENETKVIKVVKE